MTILDSTVFKISEDTFEYAKEIASGAKDEFSRKRIYESVLCMKTLADYFKTQGYITDINNCFYKIPLLNEEFELNEFRCNGRCIDVRPVVNEKYVLIPKSLYDYNILPDLFAVAKFNKEKSTVNIIGCIEPLNIDRTKQNEKYYIADTAKLIQPFEIEDRIKLVNNIKISDRNHNLYASYFIDYCDGILPEENKKELLKHLSECKGCREKFIDFVKFEAILKHASEYPDMLQDKMLNFVAATDVDNDKYKDFKEVTIEIEKEPDKYEENEEDLPDNTDPLNVLYGNKNKNDDAFDKLSQISQKQKSILDTLIAEISSLPSAAELKTDETDENGAENTINPDLYKEDYSDGIEDIVESDTDKTNESDTVSEEKTEPDNESETESDNKLKTELETELEMNEEMLKDNGNKDDEFDYVQDIFTSDSDIDEDNDNDNSIFVHNVKDEEQPTSSNASELINDEDFIPDLSDLAEFMNSHRSDKILQEEDEVIVINEDEENNDYEKLGSMINTAGLQRFPDIENEPEDILIIDDDNDENIQEKEVSSAEPEDVSDVLNSTDKIDVGDIDIIDENEEPAEAASEKTEKKEEIASEDNENIVTDNNESQTVSEKTEKTEENASEDNENVVTDNNESETVSEKTEKTEENASEEDEIVIIDDNETEAVSEKAEKTEENASEEDEIVIIDDNETEAVSEKAEKTEENASEKDEIAIIDDNETEAATERPDIAESDLIDIPGLDVALTDFNDISNNSMLIDQISENISNDMDNFLPNLGEDIFYNENEEVNNELPDSSYENKIAVDSENNQRTSSETANSKYQNDEDIIFIDDNEDDDIEYIRDNSKQEQPKIYDNLSGLEDDNDIQFIDNTDEEPVLNEPLQKSYGNNSGREISVEENNEDEFIIIDDDDETEDNGTFMRPASVVDLADLSLDGNETTTKEIINDDKISDDTKKDTHDEASAADSEKATPAEQNQTADEDMSDKSEDDEKISGDDSENEHAETIKQTTEDSESSSDSADDTESSADDTENEHDDTNNQIIEDSESLSDSADDTESLEDGSENGHDEIINQIFEDRNSKTENDEETSDENEDENDVENDDENVSENDDESEEDDTEDDFEEDSADDKNGFIKKILIAVIASVLALATAGGGIYYLVNKFRHNDVQDSPAVNTEEQLDLNNSGNIQQNDENTGLPEGIGSEDNNPNPEAQPAVPEDNNTAETPDNNTADNPSAVKVSKTSWIVAPYIASELDYKTFLQNAGHVILTDIKQKLATVNDDTNLDNAKIQITVTNNQAKEITVLKSSGSKQIDDIVLQSVKDYIKNNQIPKLSDNAIQSVKNANGKNKFKITFSVNF